MRHWISQREWEKSWEKEHKRKYRFSMSDTDTKKKTNPNDFTICPDCNGEGGSANRRDGFWEDCKKCNGEGFIKKENKKKPLYLHNHDGSVVKIYTLDTEDIKEKK